MNRFLLYIILVFLLPSHALFSQEDSTQYVVFAGYYHNQIDSNERSLQINVEDYDTGEQLGTFKSNIKTGFFVLVLPPRAQYKYTIIPKGSDIPHYALIQRTKESNELVQALKQDIQLIRDGAEEEAMIIRNFFDEEFTERENEIIFLHVFGE